MRKINNPELCDYVLVIRGNIWHVGYIISIIKHKEKYEYKVFGSDTKWLHCFRISKREGKELLTIKEKD